MNDPPPTLRQVQRWLQAVIAHPGGVHAGASSAAARSQIDVAPEELNRVIEARGALDETQCLAIYNRGYHLRLLECFRAEFPILLHALGAPLFEQFALDYLQHYPSTSYSLFHLCENFPRHLAETRPDHDLPPESREGWPDFIVDLATLERSFNEVFAGSGVEGQTIVDPAQIDSLDAVLSDLRFEPAVCLRLEAFQYPVLSYFDAVREAREPELPDPAETWVAINRRNFRVVMWELSRLEYQVLAALLAGATLGQATIDATNKEPAHPLVSNEQLRSWVLLWAERGFLVACIS